jgi:hypothetical protein
MNRSVTAFSKHRVIARGPLFEVEAVVGAALLKDPAAGVLIIDDQTGAVVDLDASAKAPKRMHAPPPSAPSARAGVRGRPKLGVTAREVTLLPRHWAWLGSQRGGASAALRRLVETASRQPEDPRRRAQEAAYSAMTALGGDLPGYEEAVRALFRHDEAGVRAHLAPWPEDLSRFVVAMAFPAGATP